MEINKKIPWTLKKKTGLAFLGIFVCVLIVYVAQLMYVNVLQMHYKKVEKLNTCYYRILTETEAFHNALTEYSYGNGNLTSIITIAECMKKNAVKFREILNEESYDRSSIDLANLVENYATSGLRRADYFDKRQYAKCITEAQNFERINGYIIQKFAEADSSVRIYAEKMYALNDVYLTRFRTILLLVILLMGVVFFGLIVILWGRVINPIVELSHATKQYRLGNFSQLRRKINTDKRDETGELTESILEMIQELEKTVKLKQQNVELKLEKLNSEKLAKEVQLKLMQSRINPHFLFNSFNVITEMAFLEEAEQTYELLEALGSFLRYNLDKFDKIVKIGQEIENLQSYLVVQRKRFGERITFCLDYDPLVCEIKIPCLILQPLVENAIIHGVGSMKNGGIVWICVQLRKGNVEISVADNGRGMEDLELSRVRRLIDTATDQDIPSDILDEGGRNCIGVRNVFGRLKLFYRDSIQVIVTSEPYVSTDFKVIIPLEEDGGWDA